MMARPISSFSLSVLSVSRIAMRISFIQALYSGVLTFWVSDQSPKQVETLAFIDHSVALFCASLSKEGGS